MVGRQWVVHARWLHQQRRSWREHDATLASAWRDQVGDAEPDDITPRDGVALIDDVILLDGAGPSMVVLP